MLARTGYLSDQNIRKLCPHYFQKPVTNRVRRVVLRVDDGIGHRPPHETFVTDISKNDLISLSNRAMMLGEHQSQAVQRAHEKERSMNRATEKLSIDEFEKFKNIKLKPKELKSELNYYTDQVTQENKFLVDTRLTAGAKQFLGRMPYNMRDLALRDYAHAKSKLPARNPITLNLLESALLRQTEDKSQKEKIIKIAEDVRHPQNVQTRGSSSRVKDEV